MQKRRVKKAVSPPLGSGNVPRPIQSAIAVAVLFVQIALPITQAFASETVETNSSPSETVTTEASAETEEVEEEVAPPAHEEVSVLDVSGDQIENTVVTDLEVNTELEDDTTLEEQDVIVLESEIPIREGVEESHGGSEQTSVDAPAYADTEATPEPPLEEPAPLPISEEPPVGVTDESFPEPETDDVSEAEVGETEEESDEDSEATSTEEVTVVAPEVHTVTNDENRFSFGVNDCAQVADGSFYCKADTQVEPISEENRVFAGPDIDGDSEIYIEKDGIVTQLTTNLVDDAAPYYDPESESLVWHRLVDARYQIVSYDLLSDEEVVMTNDHYNNMQPSRSGDLTVWQGWIGNDWEILLSDDGEITMLTDNTHHDIGPRINGEYVIWQAEETDGWKVRIYNRLTKETETIADADGASIENPRFVLLYDAKRENGDVETRGYDLESKKNVPLAAQPQQVPDEIPDPDQTGEDRALISTTTQLKTKTEEDTESEPGPDPLEEAIPTPVATTTDDIVIPPFAEATSTVTDTHESATPLPSDTDLVIEPLPVEEEVLPLEDLVVTPYVPSTVEELDSQDTVATSS